MCNESENVMMGVAWVKNPNRDECELCVCRVNESEFFFFLHLSFLSEQTVI